MTSLPIGVLVLALGAGIELPSKITCIAIQTAGFHDYPHNEEAYEPVVFFESAFALEVNQALTQHLAELGGPDLYLTLSDDDKLVELSCFKIRGAGDTRGLSCSNQPPADLLLINLGNLRFTRTAIGGWTFTGAQAGAQTDTSGDSIYVEYGQCAVD